MEPVVRARANEIVDAFADAGEVELVSQLALPLPLSVLADLLGVDPARHLLKRWSEDLVRGIAAVLDDAERLVVARSLLDFQVYFRARIEERLDARRDDLLSDLVHASSRDGSRLELEELFPIIAQLVAAGHETTTNFICNSAVILLRATEPSSTGSGRTPRTSHRCSRSACAGTRPSTRPSVARCTTPSSTGARSRATRW